MVSMSVTRVAFDLLCCSNMCFVDLWGLAMKAHVVVCFPLWHYRSSSCLLLSLQMMTHIVLSVRDDIS